MKPLHPLLAVTIFSLTFFFSSNLRADCAVTGSTPGSGEVVNCTGVDADGYPGTNNPDEVSIQVGADIGSSVATFDHSIQLNDGNDTATMLGGTLTADDDGISGGFGSETIVVNAGTITAYEDGVDSDEDDDSITINGGTITGGAGDPDGDGIDGGQETTSS